MNPNFDPDNELLDRPYLKIVEEHQSLAPIVDLQLRDKLLSKQGLSARASEPGEEGKSPAHSGAYQARKW